MKNWMLILTALLSIFILAACGKSLEEQIETGIESAKATFEGEIHDPNTTVVKINVFLPSGYTIEESEDESNYLLKKDGKEFILFVNENEGKNSKLLYDLFKENIGKEIIKEETIENEEEFGFTAVLKNDEDSYELIVNSGGVKVSTLSDEHNIDSKLEEMMQIARSVNL